jgi:hypothetical protein
MSCQLVENEILEVMRRMDNAQLLQFAEEVGVQDIDTFLTREDLQKEIVRLELYAFTH